MELLQFDVVVIGGGVVGMACAHHLSKHDLSVLVLEKNPRFGMESTARNSEVIHAGFYYAEGSLKERLCIRGRTLLYAFCQKYDVPHRRSGKLIVASSTNEFLALDKIISNAARNEIPIHKLSHKKIQKLEPKITGQYALESPTTGIICSEIFLQRLRGLAEAQGALAICEHKVTHWEKSGLNYMLYVKGPNEERFQVSAPLVVNAAGFQAFRLGNKIFGSSPPFEIKYVRGHYFSLNQRYKNITSRLIYPVPDVKGGGLGIHLTLDLEGNARLGPDIDWSKTDQVSYSFVEEEVPHLVQKFYISAKRYLPELRREDLQPGFIGVRPKRVDSSGNLLDFYIQNETCRGYPGWINLFGIESPGLTCALSIAEEVKHLI